MQVKWDIAQPGGTRGPRPLNRAKPLQPRHPALVAQEMARKEGGELVRPTVRVKATSEKIRKLIWHPNGRRTFDKDGYAEWPNDSFTHNRVRDRDVTIVAASASPQAATPQLAAPSTPRRRVDATTR